MTIQRYKKHIVYSNSESQDFTFSWQKLATKYLAFIGEEVCIVHPIIKESCNHILQDSNKKEYDCEYIKGKVCGINTFGELLLQTNNQIVTILGGTFSQANRE